MRTVSVLGPREFDRLSTIDEKPATHPALFTGYPMPIAVLANQKDQRPHARGRLGVISRFIHIWSLR